MTIHFLQFSSLRVEEMKKPILGMHEILGICLKCDRKSLELLRNRRNGLGNLRMPSGTVGSSLKILVLPG